MVVMMKVGKSSLWAIENLMVQKKKNEDIISKIEDFVTLSLVVF